VTRVEATPAELHGLGLPDPADRVIRWCVATRRGLVLGSGQPVGDVDDEAAAVDGIDVVRRRSGGSAVVVGPGEVVWVDVTITRGDPLWADDVGVAPRWLGACWADALGRLGVAGASVHEGAMRRRHLSSLVCFAGVGPGEVTVDGRKVVGISQRRTRLAALFQVAVLLRWDPVDALLALRVPGGDRVGAVASLAGAAVGLDELLGRAVGPAVVEQAFLQALVV